MDAPTLLAWLGYVPEGSPEPTLKERAWRSLPLMGFFVYIFLYSFIAIKFYKKYKELEIEKIPRITEMIVFFSQWISAYPMLFVLLILAASAGYFKISKSHGWTFALNFVLIVLMGVGTFYFLTAMLLPFHNNASLSR